MNITQSAIVGKNKQWTCAIAAAVFILWIVKDIFLQ
jgi:pyruvoyl-dependent arginine decarboxylase (PvlArgDC)